MPSQFVAFSFSNRLQIVRPIPYVVLDSCPSFPEHGTLQFLDGNFLRIKSHEQPEDFLLQKVHHSDSPSLRVESFGYRRRLDLGDNLTSQAEGSGLLLMCPLTGGDLFSQQRKCQFYIKFSNEPTYQQAGSHH